MKKVLLFACDPGGANAIIPLIREFRKKGYNISLFGKNQALEKYRQFGLVGKNIAARIKTLSQGAVARFLAKENPSLVVTGTSANDKTEKFLWAAAKKLGIPSAAVLDQWMNYGIRFSRYGVSEMAKFRRSPKLEYLPATIFVMDEYAKRELKKLGVEERRLVASGQPYFELVRERAKHVTLVAVKKFKRRHGIGLSDYIITFASEPLIKTYGNKGAKDFFGYTERTIVRALLEALRPLAKRINPVVFIKPHPKETATEWRAVIDGQPALPFKVKILGKENAWELMKASNLVCGMTSMFLIEAVILNRPVLSIQVGAKKKRGFVLETRKILKPVLNSKTLARELQKFMDKRQGILPRFNMPQKPSLKIVNYLVKHYA